MTIRKVASYKCKYLIEINLQLELATRTLFFGWTFRKMGLNSTKASMQTPRRRVTPSFHHSAFGNRHSAFYSAFTLAELLVVIGIIIILVGILLPVISKIRYAAYNADTQNEISQISNACSAYYSTYHAYPGPFSNDDIGGGLARTNGYQGSGSTASAGPATLTYYYFNGAPTQISNFPWAVTGAENLVLGLMGGLREAVISTGPPPTYALAFAPQEVGLGPLSLNANNPSRTPSFFSTGSNYLMWCQTNSSGQTIQTTGAYQSATGSFTGTAFTDPAGTAAFDCPIPVFVDRFPAPGPLPILYLRARTGGKGVVWDNITGNGSYDFYGNEPADYQYDLRDIYPYTWSHVGLPVATGSNTSVTHNLIGIGPTLSGSVAKTTALNSTGPNGVANGWLYLANQSIPPTNTNDPNYFGRPRAVDQFILISAGPDGIYGTPDDITSFGSVSN
jgi:type II secretory pathway pseudopilin PulG